MFRSKIAYYRIDNRAHEILVPYIVRVVIMAQVVCFFRFGRKIVFRVQEYRTAIAALQKIAGNLGMVMVGGTVT